MVWMDLLGHDAVVERFRRMVRAGRLSSTFLLVGPAGIGKSLFAHRLAQSLFCQNHAESELLACGTCPACQQVAAETHPDLIVIRRPPDRAVIPVELLIGEREQRMREGMICQIATRPLLAKRKVAIIDDADDLNDEGANALLKTLEEPPPGSVILLISSSEQRQLPTIRSRSQVIRFQPLGETDLQTLLSRRGVSVDAARVSELTRLAFGSFGAALELADPDVEGFRQQLWSELTRLDRGTSQLASVVNGYLEGAGKEPAVRRDALARVVQWATMYYRDQLREATAPGGSVDPEWIAARIERCDEALEQVGANANLATLIECWLDDLQ